MYYVSEERQKLIINLFRRCTDYQAAVEEEFNMTNQKSQAMSTKNLVMYAVLTAIVVVLQLLGAFIKFGPFSISLVLVPIVIGAALLGWKGGTPF